ncbi:phage tail protein, partial [Bacillus cereus]
MADGQVRIDVGLETEQVRRDVQQVNRELGRVGSNMGRVSRDMASSMGQGFTQMNNDIARGYTQVSQAHQGMMNEMKSAYMQQKANMSDTREAQIEAQYGYFKMAQASATYTGSVDTMINRINEIGKAQKKANDQQINGNRMALISMYETIGALNNASSTASRMQNNLTQMNNPLYNTSRLAMTAVDSLDRLARSGSPQQLALEFLGANASVKQYNDFIRDLGAQMMALPVIFGLATAGAVKFYGALHGKVMEENTKYAEAYNNMIEKLTKAFEPMRQAFASVMVPVYNFVAAMAELIIKFNEAHPTLAKFIQGMMMLVPALMVLATPLALGIGYFAGLRAILFALRPVMMPIITGFGLMSAPVWIVAGAIAGLVVGFNHFYKTSETFRNAVNSSIETMKQFGLNLLNVGRYLIGVVADGGLLNDWLSHLPEGWRSVAEAMGTAIITMRTAVVSLFAPIGQLGGHFVSLLQYIWSVIAVGDVMNDWITHLPVGFQNCALMLGNAVMSIRTTIMSMVEAIRLAIGGDTSQLGQIFATILPSLIALLVGGLPGLLITASRFLPTIVEGINSMMPMLTSTITNVITGMVNMIVTYLPQFLTQGIAILTKVIEGLLQVLPQVITTLVNVATQMINSFVNIIGTLLPVILDAGIKILMAVIDGIVKSLPSIIDACIKVITTLVNALVNLLPKIIDAGIKILMALIDGIIKILPQLIQAGITIMTKLLDSIIKNLPQILSAGMKILSELIKGIVKILPQLISMGLKLIMDLARAIISNLPQILSAGVQIIGMLIKGIISMVGSLLSTITSNVIGGIKNCFSNAGSMLLNIGKDIINGLINGIS